MVKRQSPLMTLAAVQIRHSFPTALRGAMNASRFIASRIFPKSQLARKVHHAIRNWYEAGWPIWTGGNFSYLPSLVQDARWDQSYVTRREMLRRMRYWAQNSPIVESVLSVGERYTVGASGLHVSFYPEQDPSADGDGDLQDNWYDRADSVVAEWFRECGWNGESMEQLLKVGYRCQRIDGDHFFVKTRKSMPLSLGNSKLKVFKPALQAVEAHRVETPFNKWGSDVGDTLIDGVQYEKVDVGGSPMLQRTGFWIRNSGGAFETNDSWVFMTCDDVFQLRNVQRVDQPRAVSDFFACAITINKLEDILEIEMKAQNTQSVRAVAIKSSTGQLNPIDPKRERIDALRGIVPPQNQEQPLQGRCETFSRETGAYAFGLRANEDVINLAPNRPSEATLQLLEFQINSVCAAVHSPRCLTFGKISAASARSQGTEVRAELDSADAFYRSDYQKWENFVRGAVIYFMEWAIENDPRVAEPPEDWRNCIHIQQPEACNVDPGYNTQAQLTMLAAGAMDYSMILGPQGLNPVTVFKRLARQQKMIEKLGIRITLPALLPGQLLLNGEKPQPTEHQEANA